MNMRNSTKIWVPAALLVSVVAVAEQWHPSGFQPAPVFEDEGLVGRAVHPRPAHPEPARTVAPAPQPVAPKPVAEPHAQPLAARPATSVSPLEEAVVAATNGDHRPRFEPAPVFEDEHPARKAAPAQTPAAVPKAADAPAAVPAKPASPAPGAAKPAAAKHKAEQASAAAPAQASGGWGEILASNYPIALVVLALAGYVFWSTRRAGGPVPGDSPARPEKSAKTGVARYLEGMETGVAKYLRNIG
jgi:hypothetical protein